MSKSFEDIIKRFIVEIDSAFDDIPITKIIPLDPRVAVYKEKCLELAKIADQLANKALALSERLR